MKVFTTEIAGLQKAFAEIGPYIERFSLLFVKDLTTPKVRTLLADSYEKRFNRRLSKVCQSLTERNLQRALIPWASDTEKYAGASIVYNGKLVATRCLKPSLAEIKEAMIGGSLEGHRLPQSIPLEPGQVLFHREKGKGVGVFSAKHSFFYGEDVLLNSMMHLQETLQEEGISLRDLEDLPT